MTSTFPQDIELALYTALNNFTIADANGVMQPVPAFYSSPEVEIEVETHPSLVFYQSAMSPDPSRATNNKLYSNVVTTNGNVTSVGIRDDAYPFLLYYDIRIYTLYEQDSRELEKSIMQLFPWRGIISVNGANLDMIFQKRIDLTKLPGALNASAMRILEKAPQREQVIALRYKICTSFDVHAAKTYATVQEVDYTVNTK